MRRLLPPPAVELAPIDALADFPEADGRLAVRAVMVQSVDGRVAVEGRSTPLTGPGDQRVYLANRALADVVVVGARTARDEGYGPSRLTPELVAAREGHGRSPVPPVAVVSRSLDLDTDAAFFTAASARPLVITTTDSDPAGRRRIADHADLIVLDAPLDPVTVCEALHARGHRRAVLEGGPSLVASFLAADRIDEFCVSLSPQIVGDGPGLSPGLAIPVGLSVHAVLEDDGFVVLLSRGGARPRGSPPRRPWHPSPDGGAR